ncbi:MAG: tRNA (adenosine(37)-N6)-threonylcarbamoyltransferase complex ATPase subunit type 1 TsaE, partial [Christensenellales bacterium]
AWGVEGHVTSPTFTTMQQYDGARGRFYHFDLYRLDDPEQLFETGLNEYIGGDGLAVIEWPENADLDPADAYTVYVNRVEPGDVPEDERVGFTDEDGDGYARMIRIAAPGEEEA